MPPEDESSHVLRQKLLNTHQTDQGRRERPRSSGCVRLHAREVRSLQT